MTTTRAPSNLGKAGKRLWKRVVTDFALEGHHLEVLEQACRALDRCEACRVRINADGEMVFDRFDQPKAHPLLQVERDQRSLLFRAMNQLGLNAELPNVR